MGFWDSIFAPGEAEKSAQFDAQLDALNKQALLDHKIEELEYERRRAAIYDGSGHVSPNAVSDEFIQGFKDAASERQGQIRSVLEAPINWTLGIVPWWGWVALAGAVFWYLGGAVWARGALNRALK